MPGTKFGPVGIFKSTNGGTTWQAASSGLGSTEIYALAIDPSAPSTVYAGTLQGIYKSINAGATWAAASTGIGSSWIQTLAVDPASPATLYAGMWSASRGLFKTTNGGTTWAPSAGGLALPVRVHGLAVDRVDSAKVYAVGPYGVYRSLDHGASWSLSNAGLTSVFATAVAAHPSTSGTAYAATVGTGLFKSVDAAANWQLGNRGMTNATVSDVILPPGTGLAFASSATAGRSGSMTQENSRCLWAGAASIVPRTRVKTWTRSTAEFDASAIASDPSGQTLTRSACRSVPFDRSSVVGSSRTRSPQA